MKSYAIYDEGLDRESAIGYLFYYEKAKSFIIELCKDLDEWDAPLLFQGLVRKGIYTVSRDISLMWVKERVIPSGRQNIGSILKNYKMKEYSEMALLSLSKGRCSQDSCYIAEVSEEKIPETIKDRMRKNVCECFQTEDKQLVCMFKDDTVRKVDLTRLIERYKDILYVLKNKELLDSVQVGVGGYSIVFNESIEIQSYDLREIGLLLPLTANDFYNFVSRNIVDATQACEMLQCSRQNLSYLVKEDKIKPVICGTKENMYLRGELERIMNE
ncbi:hypothetical protein [Anaerostipes sp.]|uniref:hypothetical protein n=1 Tax=Anaerostipes sp. TaxID=1872530 RepID=UPI00258B79D0|nr:hypothetical protein [Anaerostipes sp.]MCI5622941.1 hypothetical protein [Anaerostipes sp.]